MAAVSEEKDFEKTLSKIAGRYTEGDGNVISLLQDLQDGFDYIPEEAVGRLSEELDIPESRFFGVMTFYSQFHLKPRGKHVITACCGTACHVKGSDRLINALRNELNLAEGQDTTEDMEFTVEKLACVGACSIAPVVIIDKKIYGEVNMSKLMKELKSRK